MYLNSEKRTLSLCLISGLAFFWLMVCSVSPVVNVDLLLTAIDIVMIYCLVTAVFPASRLAEPLELLLCWIDALLRWIDALTDQN
ncbi:MAG: hypothetical protein Q7J73_11240 [Dehalococcoidales bacterium]|nr:hypothetical protein [Dehalococcoidales bacterium]